MLEGPVGLDAVQFITTVSALVTAAAATYIAARVRSVYHSLVSTIEGNEERSRRNERLLLGSHGTDGVIERLSEIEDTEGRTDV